MYSVDILPSTLALFLPARIHQTCYSETTCSNLCAGPVSLVNNLIYSHRHSFEQWLPVEEAEEVCQHSPALLW